jgi:hypothetical protein
MLSRSRDKRTIGHPAFCRQARPDQSRDRARDVGAELDSPAMAGMLAGQPMRAALKVWRSGRPLALAAVAALLVTPAAAAGNGWRAAIDRVIEEKMLAEGCVSILKSSAVDHPMVRVQGERLYARAQADVDGMIALLVAALTGDRVPPDSPELRHGLASVPRQREALCRHVQAALGASVDQRNEGASAPVDLLIRGSADSGGSLVEAALEIWQAYRRGGEVRRRTISSGLEAARWLPYAEVR